MSIKLNDDTFRIQSYNNESKPLFVFKKDMYLINLIKKKVDRKSSVLMPKVRFPKINRVQYSVNLRDRAKWDREKERDNSFKNSFIIQRQLQYKSNSILNSPRIENLRVDNQYKCQKNNLSFERSLFSRKILRKTQGQFFDSLCNTPLRDNTVLKNQEIVSLIKKYRNILIEDCDNNVITPKGCGAN